MSTVEPGGELPVGAPGPTVLRMMLGNQLHQLREAAGVTPEQAGYEIRASRSKISRMENGRVSFKGAGRGRPAHIPGAAAGVVDHR